jgi:septal ring-binding cell division protein DamX
MNLDKRSKVIIGLIVVALIILIWQLSLLFGGNVSLKPAPKIETMSIKKAIDPRDVIARHNQETASLLATGVENTTGDNAAANQQKYLALVNEYQMLEIQRMIAQDQAAIAQSRAATAEALAKVAQAGGTASAADLGMNDASVNNTSDYELIYTGEDNGEWTATLKKNGQFNDVTTGSTLPDGAKILSVDDNGVLIQSGNQKRLVTFNGVMPVDSNAAIAAPQQATTVVKPIISAEVEKEAPKPAAATLEAKSLAAEKPLPSKSEATTQKVEQPPKAILPPMQPVPTKPVAPKTVAPAPVKAAAPPVLPKVVATNVSADFDITKADKNTYTIQVVADNSMETVAAFIKENHLSGKAQAIKTLRGQKPWYIGVYGSYPTASEAEAAIEHLPEAVQDEEPFVKRVSEVQAKMEKQK